jgi:hypothetical protein
MTTFLSTSDSNGKSNDYPYHQMIKDPNTLGIRKKGDKLEKNIKLLRSYVDVLTTGNSKAAVGGKPLGNKYFLPTGIKCNTVDGEEVDRHIYINNVPDGVVPIMGVNENYDPTSVPPGNPFRIINNNETSLKGLVPGMIGGMSRINPLGIFMALTGDTSTCQSVNLETIDIDNVKGYDRKYLAVSEIEGMSPCWFPDRKNPITNDRCIKIGFTNMDDDRTDISNVKKITIAYVSLITFYIFLNVLNIEV